MRKSKRGGPPAVPAVAVGGLRIEAIHWGKERGFPQNGGYIAAYDPATGRELWTLKVYDIQYNPARESDVQDIFIRQMAPRPSGQALEVVDERGRHYLVDLAPPSARPLP